MKKKQNINAILLMGGSGRRFNSDIPKQFHHIAGRPIYRHTLDQFQQMELFVEIILVCHPQWIDEVKKVQFDPRVHIIAAGNTRQESSYLGLLTCKESTTHVVIHDAVRPFVSRKILLDNIEKVVTYGAVDTCISSADTLVHSTNGLQITSIPPRQEYLRGQTPQSFEYDLILTAHIKAKESGKENASDDCQLIVEQGGVVHIIKGEEGNIKITTEWDLALAEQIAATYPAG